MVTIFTLPHVHGREAWEFFPHGERFIEVSEVFAHEGTEKHIR